MKFLIFNALLGAIVVPMLVSAQQKNKTGELIINDSTINIQFNPKEVWKNQDTLVIYDRFGTNRAIIRPFEYDKIYLNNSPILSIEYNDKKIFAQGLVLNGKAKLYRSIDASGDEWFYIRIGEGDIERVDKNGIANFFQERIGSSDYRTAEKIDRIVMPERTVYHTKFFEDLIYTYNAGQNPDEFTEVSNRLYYKSFPGLEAGFRSGGGFLGFFTQIPVSKFLRFDSEFMLSFYKETVNAQITFASKVELDAKVVEIGVPIGIRAVSNRRREQFSVQAGLIPRFAI